MEYKQNRTADQCRYFASDLNMYINETIPKDMTCTNIDTCLLKLEKENNPIRIIESKHSSEHNSKMQDVVLSILGEIAIYLDETNFKHKLDIYKVIGDYPFDNGVVIYSYKTAESKEFDKQELNDFLYFVIDFNKVNKRNKSFEKDFEGLI